MSYSFTIRGATKAEAKRMVVDELARLRDVSAAGVSAKRMAGAEDRGEQLMSGGPDHDRLP